MRKKVIVFSCILSALLMVTGCANKKSTTAKNTDNNGYNTTTNQSNNGSNTTNQGNNQSGTKAPQTQTAPNPAATGQPVPNSGTGGNSSAVPPTGSGSGSSQYNTSGNQNNTNSTNNNGNNQNTAGTNNAQTNQSNMGIQYMSTIEADILKYTNEERQKNGLKPLTINSTAFKYARSKSEEMIRLNYFDHKSPVNGYITDIANKNSWRYSNIGENIYTMSFSGQRVEDVASGQKIVQSWMNSPGHRANILNGNYTQIGIGVAAYNGKVMATQIFYTP
ncbi:CAP domain-containing protein [Clostridium manihotivorum]|uniref:SCP domain-containing protein n=1 Tax=Clostridium manihotivorum TaxID=2320868 RepID=A0A410DU35_9CLOT|nr:CAP domain-containing protein [Clostridium manihotivorum]QAA32595.1 hypothetical protein C1I91_13640 [Clostridium manihotivorum]